MAAPEYLHEYVSAIIPMGPITIGTEWELEILLANRGSSTEYFRIYLHGGAPNWEILLSPDSAVEPSRLNGHGFAFEVEPGVVASEVWWARVLTTSLNLVPTMRFHVEGSTDIPGTPNPAVPEFFFGPGDFAVFPVRAHLPLPTAFPTGTATRVVLRASPRARTDGAGLPPRVEAGAEA